jgi:DNA invertase Pin-like site-specific DNA recombinase
MPYSLRILFAKLEAKMAIVGYARVSTRDQDLTVQLEALKSAGAEPIFREKVSGVRADRPQLAKMMAKLMPRDIVVVTKLDRLGRSTRELLELIERIGKAGASFRSLGDPLFDTTGVRDARSKGSEGAAGGTVGPENIAKQGRI